MPLRHEWYDIINRLFSSKLMFQKATSLFQEAFYVFIKKTILDNCCNGCMLMNPLKIATFCKDETFCNPFI